MTAWVSRQYAEQPPKAHWKRASSPTTKDIKVVGTIKEGRTIYSAAK